MSYPFIAGAFGNIPSPSTQNTLTLAYASAPVVGHTVILLIAIRNVVSSPLVSSVTDSFGNVFSLATSTAITGERFSIYYSKITGSGSSGSIVVTLADVNSFTSASYAEYSGVGTLDAVNGVSGNSTSPSSSISPVASGELLIMGIGSWTGDSITPDASSWTQRENSGSSYNPSISQSDQTGTASGTYSANGTISGIGISFPWIVVTASFLPGVTVFNESVAFGVGSGTAIIPNLTFEALSTLGIQGGTAEGASADMVPSFSIGSVMGTVPLPSVSITQSLTFGSIQGYFDAGTVSITVALSFGLSQGTNPAAVASIVDRISLGSMEGVSDSFQAAFGPSVQFGAGVGISNSALNSIATAIAVRIAAAVMVVSGGTVYVENINLGVGAATVPTVVASVLAVMSAGLVAGTSPSVQAVVNAAMAAGVAQGIASSTTVSSQASIVLGTMDALQLAASVSATLSGLIAVSLGTAASNGQNLDLQIALGTLAGYNPQAVISLSVRLGLAIGIAMSDAATVGFDSQLSLGLFCSLLISGLNSGPAGLAFLRDILVNHSSTSDIGFGAAVSNEIVDKADTSDI